MEYWWAWGGGVVLYFHILAPFKIELFLSLHLKLKSWNYYFIVYSWIESYVYCQSYRGYKSSHSLLAFSFHMLKLLRGFSVILQENHIFLHQGATNTEKAKIGLSRWFLVTLWTPSWVNHPSGQWGEKKWVRSTDAEWGNISGELHCVLSSLYLPSLLGFY